MKKIEEIAKVKVKYIFDFEEPIKIEYNEKGLYVNDENIRFIKNINFYIKDDKRIIEVNRFLTEDDLKM